MGKLSMKTTRTLVALIFIVITCIGLAFHTGFGTFSQYGIGVIATLCPLGGIEAILASHSILPFGVLGIVIVVVLILIFGRAFCSWACPTSLVRRIFGLKSPYERRLKAEKKDEKDANAKTGAAAANRKADDAPAPHRGGMYDSRLWVLIGMLVATLIFGFPVFCLVCPVGLSFATVISVWRAIQFGEATWSLIVFPAILILEIVVFRRWCHTLCPLGALVSLISRGNRTFKATIDGTVCLKESKGIACDRCVDVCPEGIDMHPNTLSTPTYECLKCGECSQVCPVHAITFPFMPEKKRKGLASSETDSTLGAIAGAGASVAAGTGADTTAVAGADAIATATAGTGADTTAAAGTDAIKNNSQNVSRETLDGAHVGANADTCADANADTCADANAAANAAVSSAAGATASPDAGSAAGAPSGTATENDPIE